MTPRLTPAERAEIRKDAEGFSKTDLTYSASDEGDIIICAETDGDNGPHEILRADTLDEDVGLAVCGSLVRLAKMAPRLLADLAAERLAETMKGGADV